LKIEKPGRFADPAFSLPAQGRSRRHAAYPQLATSPRFTGEVADLFLTRKAGEVAWREYAT
jgi:hypothetical protein